MAVIREWTQQELLEHMRAEGGDGFVVFLYTPFCGTCKWTERMLEIILTMQPHLPLFKSNVNFLPQIVRDWQIRSVPCIVLKEPEKEMELLYRMESVDALYAKLGPLVGPGRQDAPSHNENHNGGNE